MSEQRWYTTYLAVVPDDARVPLYLSRRIKRRRRRYQALSDLHMALNAHLQRRKQQMTAEESVRWVKLAFDLMLLPNTLATDPDGRRWGIERRRHAPSDW
jgi:hypothetical protein